MKSDILARLLNRIPLFNRLQVMNEMAFIDLLTELGYREDKMWTPDEDERLHKLMVLAKELTKRQIEEINKFRKTKLHETDQPS